MSEDEQTPAETAETTADGLQVVFHAPDGTPLVFIACPPAAQDAAGVHLPALPVLQALFANYTHWQQAQQKPSGIVVPNGHSRLSVAEENTAKLRAALQQIAPRTGKRHD